MLLAVTGGIGCGKSLVARFLGELVPATVYSSDEICRQLLEKDQPGYIDLVEVWGDKFLTDSGDIDRPLLRASTFDDRQIREQLESILHPLVRLKFQQVRKNSIPGTIQVGEVPLLFECGWEADFDRILCVTADRQIVIKRVVERDLISRIEVERIIAIQMDPDVKASRSDWIIDNSNGPADTRKQVEAIVALLQVLKDN